MHLLKVVGIGLIGGICIGIFHSMATTFFGLIPLIGGLAIFFFLVFTFAWDIVGPLLLVYPFRKRLCKGEGVVLGVSYGFTFSITSGLVTALLSLIVGAILSQPQLTESGTMTNTMPTLFALFGATFYIIAGICHFVIAMIIGAIAGWFAEKRWIKEHRKH
ncbi:MAG: hypothetical protein J7K68_01955 [Candidatus Diapherotrites archaeon]|nr:hypothetical protein [Candidatus Diapherotrites archaeon]